MNPKQDITLPLSTWQTLIDQFSHPVVLSRKSKMPETTMLPEIVLVNQAFTQVVGYTQSEITSSDLWFETLHPDPSYRAYVKAQWLAQAIYGLKPSTPTLVIALMLKRSG